MTKAFELDWKVPVPKELLEGSTFDRWTEDKESTDLENDCLFKVDDCGFFIFWKSEGREGDVLELSQVNDIRVEEFPKDERLKNNLIRKHGENFIEKVSYFKQWKLNNSRSVPFQLTTFSNLKKNILESNAMTVYKKIVYTLLHSILQI